MQSPKRIACIRADRIGDMVCLLPALASLRAGFPAARIDVICSGANAPVLEHDPNVDRIHVLPYPPREQSIRMTWALLHELRTQQYDVVLAFYSRSHTHLATALSGARVRAGFDNKRFQRFLTHIAPSDLGWHEIERNLALIEAIGLEPVTRQPVVHTSDVEENVAQTWLQQHHRGGPLIALHAGATAPGRRYAPPRLAEAVRELMPEATFVIFEGPIDEDETRTLRGFLPNAHAFKGSLLEMAALLKHCDLAVMNDSGPMHIAAASGTPTVGIFGPSPLARWYPRGNTTAIQAESWRVDDIAPSQIADAARSLLERVGGDLHVNAGD